LNRFIIKIIHLLVTAGETMKTEEIEFH